MIRRLLAAALLAAATGLSTGAAGEARLLSTAGEIIIRPLAHASVALHIRERVIYVDPWTRALQVSVPASDLILITDADGGAHHLDPTAIQRVRARGGVVVIPAAGLGKVPDGVVMRNGDRQSFGDVTVEAIPAYDLLPGEPFHAKGAANGYVVTLGDRRILFAGVTECVQEIRSLRNVDVAFLPMNLPNGRMSPAAVAECVRAFRPTIVYPYHYDQGYIGRLGGRGSADGSKAAAASVRVLADALDGVAEVRTANWYPAR